MSPKAKRGRPPTLVYEPEPEPGPEITEDVVALPKKRGRLSKSSQKLLNAAQHDTTPLKKQRGRPAKLVQILSSNNPSDVTKPAKVRRGRPSKQVQAVADDNPPAGKRGRPVKNFTSPEHDLSGEDVADRTDSVEVDQEREGIEDQTEEENEYQEDEENEDWEEAMKEHWAFVKSLGSKGDKVSATEAKKGRLANELEKFVGCYIIRCPSLDDYELEETPTIDINLSKARPHVLESAVKFGVIEGTMILGATEQELDEYIEDVAAKGGIGEEFEHRNDDDDKGKGGLPGTKKRKSRPVGREKGPSKKKAKATSIGSRLHLRFRGRETYEGKIFFNPHAGHLDLIDSNCTQFKGVASMPYLGDKCEFMGFKVDAIASNVAEDWNNFSEHAYENERVSRWG
ncbi:hypothetical protein B0J11DRAFT_344968 [Dendryphion nanum]|uniref:Uncharacterized protein n=1 Tax=Dendryphion nanum TaxID=256645 RepID=A0A9P9IJK9_9PLEO|nr:hypothetical protein B0J11DRAFT_344968 [Dendryphion nanum]